MQVYASSARPSLFTNRKNGWLRNKKSDHEQNVPVDGVANPLAVSEKKNEIHLSVDKEKNVNDNGESSKTRPLIEGGVSTSSKGKKAAKKNGLEDNDPPLPGGDDDEDDNGSVEKNEKDIPKNPKRKILWQTNKRKRQEDLEKKKEEPSDNNTQNEDDSPTNNNDNNDKSRSVPSPPKTTGSDSKKLANNDKKDSLPSSTTSSFNYIPTNGPAEGLVILGGGSPFSRGFPPGTNHGFPTNPMMPPGGDDNSVGAKKVLFLLQPYILRILTVILYKATSGFGRSNSVYSPFPKQHFFLERINDRYAKDDIALKKACQYVPNALTLGDTRWNWIQFRRKQKLKKQLLNNSNNNTTNKTTGKEKKIQQKKNMDALYGRTVIVVDLTIDSSNGIDAKIEEFRDTVSFLVRQYENMNGARLNMGQELEVILCVESPGGGVQEFGLLANQVARLKSVNKGKASNVETEREGGEEEIIGNGDLKVTICVDKIAASGGYMIACQADPGQLLSAPFALLGSIGVFTTNVNIHDLLEKYGVQSLMLKSGDAKAPLTSTTKMTEEGLLAVQENLEKTHEAFRNMIMEARGDKIDTNDVEEVTSGQVFLGNRALTLGLVDRILTSDEYISERISAGDRVLRLHKYDSSRRRMLSPIDLLLLKSGGFMGKVGLLNGSSIHQNLSKVISLALPILKVGGTVGLMKFLTPPKP